jgi:hypothetical protein
VLGRLLTMSAKEMDRLGVVQRVLEGRLPQKQAAQIMGVTPRQVRRLCTAYDVDGAAGLVSKSRGKPSNRRLAADVRGQAMVLVRERYADFGPTLAAEKLAEVHGRGVSHETLRHWMKADGIWLTRTDRVPTPHQPRFRRECLGELVQIDGCEHHWFEDRGPYCSLLVYVDDATGRLMELLFVTTESACGYFEATISYLRRHGKPVAFYSDKHSILRVANEGTLGIHKGVVTRDQDVESATAKRFVVRWVRRRALLYERSVKGEAVGTGRPIVEDKLLGQVDATVAQEWQARGDSTVPPPLHAEDPAGSSPVDRPLSPGRAVDTSQRLSAALWFTDTFRADQMQRVRVAEQAASDAAFMSQFRDEEGVIQGRRRARPAPPTTAAQGAPRRAPEKR